VNRRLVFVGPGQVRVDERDEAPGPGQVALAARVSALSAGTERLLWQGRWPEGVGLDGLWSPDERVAYPVAFGYALVGDVVGLGLDVDPAWLGRRVFAFAPHQSRPVVDLDRVVAVPDDVTDDDAVFLATLETAVCLAQDAAPVWGETVAVWGLGALGLLTAALLSPGYEVLAWDEDASRRLRAAAWGLAVGRPSPESVDVAVDVTGHAAGLDGALACTRFSGRVVAGSWYGAEPVSLQLGGRFHRSRLQVIASQVSSLAPALAGRWTKARRFEAAWAAARRWNPARLITHRYAIDDAAQAYELACERRGDVGQVVFTYPRLSS